VFENVIKLDLEALITIAQIREVLAQREFWFGAQRD
jgi:hypothetical protein